MAELQMKDPRLVRRPFNGPTLAGDPGVHRYLPGDVVDVVGWKNAEAMKRSRYIRKLEWGESFEMGPEGVARIVKSGASAGAQPKAGRERASSSQEHPEDASPAAPEPVGVQSPVGDGVTGAMGTEDDEPEEAAAENVEAPVIEPLGGGWYNVLVDGTVKNPSPIHGKKAAEEFAATL